MRSSELRIGNLIYDAAMGLATVRGTTIKGIWINDSGGPVHEDAILPIPLTEEWLLKFGFVRYKGDFFNDEDEDYIFYQNEIGEEAYLILDLDHSCPGFHIEYLDRTCLVSPPSIFDVHTLQNLYFSLTGKELDLMW